LYQCDGLSSHLFLSARSIFFAGFLEYSEFVAAAIGEKQLFKQENLKKAFEMFEPDYWGNITTAGLKRGLASFLSSDSDEVDDRVIRKIMKQVDRNGASFFWC